MLDSPPDVHAYVHRAGRVGRLGSAAVQRAVEVCVSVCVPGGGGGLVSGSCWGVYVCPCARCGAHVSVTRRMEEAPVLQFRTGLCTIRHARAGEGVQPLGHEGCCVPAHALEVDSSCLS